MRFAKLETDRGETVYVNPAQVVDVLTNTSGNSIVTTTSVNDDGGGAWWVAKGSADEVVAKLNRALMGIPDPEAVSA